MKLRVFEAFAGYGSQSLALRNLSVDYEVVAISEIDKYALQAYYAIHDKNIPNLGDISKIKVEDIPQHDLFTYSFPCIDISVAGKQNGIIKNETRSGLLYECEKIIEYCRPKYLLMENVKNLVGKKFKPQFDKWLAYLESLGYTNYWQVLNAKDYGVPQNRERVFVVSILGEHKPFKFPDSILLDKCLKDILEESVDEKHYLSEEKQGRLKLTNQSEQPKQILDSVERLGGVFDTEKSKHQIGSVYNKNGISPTLDTMQGGWRQPCIFAEGNYRIRKLTPKECFRLMGMNEEDIEKIQSTGISNTQQYKMAGNSIVINVLEEIFKNLFDINN